MKLSNVKEIAKVIALLALAALFTAGAFAGIEARMALLKLQGVEDQAQIVVQDADKSLKDTSSILNANLIHLDLILGRAERVSRSQEAYWNMVSKKTETTLDNANKVIENLATTTQDLDKNLSQVSQATTDTLSQVEPTLQATTQAINSINNLVNDPAVKDTLKNVDQGTTQAVGILKNTNDTTADIKQKVHDTLHPKWPQRLYGWLKNALTLAWIVK